ncbi:class I adenylate-forming enzyme family protein [Catenuloplanes japonicus]|uniref:class I adenylate-forming enzyme family protein n=1 Tax=Catenuloplanes japonicus TaxID=33876 RepID=UPI0005274835|nr:class I adenylate-forming enzyme family protein [Catenuloplanes japonicus]
MDFGTLFDMLEERGSRTVVHLDRPFDADPDGGLRHPIASLAALVRELAGMLAAAGATPGDRVAIVKENHWDGALLACAATRIGAVPALLSGALPPETMRTLVHRLEPALVVGMPDQLRALGDLSALRAIDLTGTTPGAIVADDLRGHDAPPPHRRHDDAPLAINHTSGTTGVPKLVVHSTTTLIRRIADFEALPMPVLTAHRGDVVASAISFVHGRAITWTASAFRHQPREVLIVTDPDPARALPMLERHRPSMVEALPSTYVRWQREETTAFRNTRLFISTFDAIHPSTVRGYLRDSARRFPVWLQGWGQTETGPLTLRLMTRRALARPSRRHPTTRHLGWPVPFQTRLRVVDPKTLSPVRRGRPGLIQARTGARCLGYLGEEHRWAAKTDGAWFHTGDIGVRDRLGGLRLLDREVDAAPGLSCMEIEDLVDERLPAVQECVLLTSPDAPPVPVLVTTDGTVDAHAWAAAVADLPRLAAPVVVAAADVPRTGTGKVRRMELRARIGGLTAPVGTGRWT